MGKILIMIAIYFHDLAVALFAVNALSVHYIGRYFKEHPDGGPLLTRYIRRSMRLAYAALAYIVLMGAIRAYYFMSFEWNPAVGRGQVAAIIVKHIVLLGLTGLGLVLHHKYRREFSHET